MKHQHACLAACILSSIFQSCSTSPAHSPTKAGSSLDAAEVALDRYERLQKEYTRGGNVTQTDLEAARRDADAALGIAGDHATRGL